MTKVYAYKWKVGGFDVECPEPSTNPQKQFLDMPRGAVSGFAQFYLRTDDAKKVLQQSSVDIVANIFTRENDGSTVWQQTDSMTWKKYIPVEIAEENQRGYSLVILRDVRHKLDRAETAKIWNEVRYVTFTASLAETITYEPLHLNSGVPATYQNIVTELLGPITAPSLPAGGSGIPRNLKSTGSTAAALDGILASLGYALTISRDGTASYVDVSNVTVPPKITAARTEKLIGTIEGNPVLHGKVTVWPTKYYPYHPKSSSTAIGGGGDAKEIILLDHELSDKNAGVLSARLTAIQTVVNAWHQAERNDYDDTFYGLFDVVPGPGITRVTWYVGDNAQGHCTRVKQYSPPMPWPDRTEPPAPTPLWGKTFNTIAADSTGEVFVDDPVSGGMWTTSSKVQFVYNRGPAIATDKRVILFPMDDRWCVVEVC
jgi:hypothetical protein